MIKIICSNCGYKEAYIKYYIEVYGLENDKLILEYPVEFCPKCKEELLSAQVVKEIEKLKYEYDTKHNRITKYNRKTKIVEAN